MKKFFIAFLAAICFSCLAAVACGNDDYYKLTFNTPSGVSVNSEVSSGASVREGYEVVFSLVIDDNAVGEPRVSANGAELTADSEGKYRFNISSDTTVDITGVSISGDNDVTFSGVDDFGWVQYLDADGNKLDVVHAAVGQEIRFKVKVSVYYGDKPYSVAADSNILTPDADGFYKFTVTGKTTVAVRGLEILTTDTFMGRNEDGGSDGTGTADDPYRIKTPADLYTMSDVIADSFYAGAFAVAYYRLENDIDMQGERLFVIGDNTSSLSVFAGTFDGNGHTISNYVMNDTLIEQSGFTNVHLPAVGLFGYAYMANIFNLNLSGFTIHANGIRYNEGVFAGGIVGYGIGTNITNCSVSGTIITDGDSSYFSYAGGIAGIQQSLYSEEEGTRYYSVVQSCRTDVDLRAESGYVFAAGGITGYLLSFEERTAAAIVNCYSTGNVSGAMRVGGIAGQLSAYSSVKNSYSTGILEATNTLAVFEGGESNSYAYAGGIVGYAEHDSIVTDSFFIGEVYASATETRFEAKDGILGGREQGGVSLIISDGALIINCAATSDTVFGTKVTGITDSYIRETLGWSEKDWTFGGNGMPSVNKNEESKTFKIIVKIGNSAVRETTVENTYIPMSYWYVLEDGVPEFIGSGAARTYGYYFDAQLTQKVPFGYVPTDDITLYAKYVDYTEVTGEYYLQSGNGRYIILDENGLLTYRDGALSCVSTYVYDGEYVQLLNTFLAIIVDTEYDFHSFKAEVDGGVMSIYDLEVYPQSSPLTALKKSDTFKYGSYFDASGNSYTFNPDGTGIIKEASGNSINFTFTLSQNAVTVSHSGVVFTGAINQDGYVTSYNSLALSVYDAFKGYWEKSAGSHKQYCFDGAGNWTYKYYGLNSNGGEVIIEEKSGTYTVNGATLTTSDGKTVILADGLLSIDGEKYYAKNSFVGTWLYSGAKDTIEITFNGISTDGYGTAVIDYGMQYGSFSVNYEAIERGGKVYIALYYYYSEYGLLEFDPAAKTLKGDIYLARSADLLSDVTLCIYDDFKGSWNSASGDFAKAVFNGLGNYDIAGTSANAPMRGRVKIYASAADTRGTEVAYTLENGTLCGSFVYNNKTYNIEYDEERGVITVNSGDGAFTLTQEG